ncbi:MAG: TraX family protein [Clostridia bacterium]|nr:TraX family protein [Clostridia bacterium]MDD4680709.1 TraX family protein [Clostridia bacterium]
MIKLIAMITMLVDHIGAVFFPNALWLRIIGRVSFPLFAWGIAMGSRWTRDWKRYAARLLAVALVTQIPYSLLFRNGYWNICFTLLSGLLVLKLLQIPNRMLGMLGTLSILALVHFLEFEYGIYGVLTILVFYYCQEDGKLPLYQGILTLTGILIYSFHVIQLFSVVSSFIVLDRKKDELRLNKWVQYGFYPIHIILLYILKGITA